MIWGLTGFARSGKDTLADHLVENHGFVKLSLAEPIRRLLTVMNPWLVPSDSQPRRLNDLLAERGGWEGLKADPRVARELRTMMQCVGTEWGRSYGDGNLWVNIATSTLDESYPGWYRKDGPRVVVPDVRFDNEARWIRLHSGRVVRVERSGVGPVNAHASEHGVNAALVQYFILNAGSLDELFRQSDSLIEREFPRAYVH